MNFEKLLLFCFSGTLLALMMLIGIASVSVYAISIKIESPLSNQQVPVGELTISGTSSDNSSSQCQVYLDWNNLKPYQLATPTGSNGSADFSKWSFTYSSKYHLIQTGLNDLTSKITCLVLPAGPTVTKWYSINVTGTTTSNQSSNVQLPLPTANTKTPASNTQTPASNTQTPASNTQTPASNTQTTSPQSRASVDTTNNSNSNKINLNLSVEHNPISAGERQTVTVTASDPQTGKTLDRVFLRLTVKDPTGNIVKDYTDNDGALSPSFRINQDTSGKYSVLASASQAGIESTKSTTFIVQ
ncbi:MAG: hypothetical protein E6L04_06675 [Thaumarchaeota archaeon]|nr:MAG: hypothetical protein E6L04_06675 [Nitrososphaerota archaeon]